MNSGDGTVYIFSKEDALAYLQAPLSGDVVTLTPSARVVIDRAGVPVTSSSRIYSDCSHARSAARMWRARRKLLEMLAAESGLNSAAREILVLQVSEAASISAAMWELSRAKGPWSIRQGSRWVTLAERTAAFELLVRSVHGRIVERPKNRFGRTKSVLPWLASLVFRGSLFVPRAQDAVVLHELRRGMAPLAEELQTAFGLDVVTIGTKALPLKSYFRHSLKMALGKRAGITLLPPPRDDARTISIVESILDRFDADEIVTVGLKAFRPSIVSACSQTAALASDVEYAFRRLKARSLLTVESYSMPAIAFGHGARRAGALVVCAGHASVTAPDGAIATPSCSIRAASMSAGDATDISVAMSPTVAAAVRFVAPDLPQIQAIPANWHLPPRVDTDEAEPALFVWAGNFSRWSEHRPWTEETADEMLDGIAAFAAAVRDAPGTSLEIRIKPNWRSKGEIDLDALNHFVPKHPRIAITSDGSFAERLGRATAVVTHCSTSLEEALRARVPVILWGARGRTHFLPGRTIVPATDSRAAVYAPAYDGDLPAFVDAISRAHRNRPLTDAELDGLVWPPAVKDLNQLASTLAAPPSRRKP